MCTGFDQNAVTCCALLIDGDMLFRNANKESIVDDLGMLKMRYVYIPRQTGKDSLAGVSISRSKMLDFPRSLQVRILYSKFWKFYFVLFLIS